MKKSKRGSTARVLQHLTEAYATAKPKRKTKAAPKAQEPPRKVVQIALSGSEHWLLCNDGTLWFGNVGNWTEVDLSAITNAPTPAVTALPAEQK